MYNFYDLSNLDKYNNLSLDKERLNNYLQVIQNNEYIEKMYISQAIGFQKPTKAFFDHVFDDLKLTEAQLKAAVMVGDSLNSDIRGGINAGIDTIWYHPKGNESPAPLCPTWQARSLEEIGRIILGE